MNNSSIKNLIFWISCISLVFVTGCSPGVKKLDIRVVTLKSINDIYIPNDSLVMPVTYDSLISLESLPAKKRKQKFINMILPSILITRFYLEEDLKRLVEICESDTNRIRNDDKVFLDSLKLIYKTTNLEELKKRLTPHPVSLALAQAAIESGWGTSRFFIEGRNAFGVKSFSEDEARIKANQSSEGTSVFLKKYDSLLESVEDYFLVLSKGPYGDFRDVRATSEDVFDVLHSLSNYSEQNEIYIDKIMKMINKNNLTRYDSYQIDPAFISH